MITIVAGKNGKSTELEMSGNLSDVLTEATMIVNVLHNAIARANPVAGVLFQHEVRIDDTVWKQKPIDYLCKGVVVSAPDGRTQ